MTTTTTINTIEQLQDAINNASLLELPSVVMPCGAVSFTNTAFIRSNEDKMYLCKMGDKFKLIVQYYVQGAGHNTWCYACENMLQNMSEEMETLTKVNVVNTDVFNAMVHYANSFFFTY